jgi:hypothetical protein
MYHGLLALEGVQGEHFQLERVVDRCEPEIEECSAALQLANECFRCRRAATYSGNPCGG